MTRSTPMDPFAYRDTWTGPASQREGFTMTPELTPADRAGLDRLRRAEAARDANAKLGDEITFDEGGRVLFRRDTTAERLATLETELRLTRRVCEAYGLERAAIKAIIARPYPCEGESVAAAIRGRIEATAALAAWRAGAPPDAMSIETAPRRIQDDP